MAEKTSSVNRSRTPASDEFRCFIGSQWAPASPRTVTASPAADYAAERRSRLSAQFPGVLLVIPSGDEKTRSNDTSYRFRAHTAFSYLTAWGSETVPGSVLVLSPTPAGHEATLFFRPPAGRESDEFYANPAIGEFWTGPRPSLEDVSHLLGITTKDIGSLEDALTQPEASAVTIRGVDPRIEQLLADQLTAEQGSDALLAQTVSEMRLVKDEHEVAEMRTAVASTITGFEQVVSQLDRVISSPRGERVVEGIFYTTAREHGHDVGYDTIAASGSHACILHWTRNDGQVAPGDLLLIDAGVERESYYTADLTRTLPVSGTFSAAQRQIYDAVLEAADAAFAVARPGIKFRELHGAAMSVIARKTSEWGWLPVSLETTLQQGYQLHRRFMVHGTSHHLGLDVHDCAQARNEMYMDGVLEPGMIFTIEPGLYIQPDDLSVPEEFRGIGVRIEDDVLVTEDGVENLTAGIPRSAEQVEAWLAALR